MAHSSAAVVQAPCWLPHRIICHNKLGPLMRECLPWKSGWFGHPVSLSNVTYGSVVTKISDVMYIIWLHWSYDWSMSLGHEDSWTFSCAPLGPACLDDGVWRHQFYLPTIHCLWICVQIAPRRRIKIIRTTVLSVWPLWPEASLQNRKSLVGASPGLKETQCFLWWKASDLGRWHQVLQIITTNYSQPLSSAIWGRGGSLHRVSRWVHRRTVED